MQPFVHPSIYFHLYLTLYRYLPLQIDQHLCMFVFLCNIHVSVYRLYLSISCFGVFYAIAYHESIWLAFCELPNVTGAQTTSYASLAPQIRQGPAVSATYT